MKMPPMKGAGKECALEKLNSTPLRYNCKNCGILTHWPLCSECFRWTKHFAATRAAWLALRAEP